MSRLVAAGIFLLVFWVCMITYAARHGRLTAPERPMVPQGTPDAGVPEPYGVCLGPKDSGKLMWWRGWGDPVPWPDPLGVRYKCKYHTGDRWFFEATPEYRAIP